LEIVEKFGGNFPDPEMAYPTWATKKGPYWVTRILDIMGIDLIA